jgi:hypothetical protein
VGNLTRKKGKPKHKKWERNKGERMGTMRKDRKLGRFFFEN